MLQKLKIYGLALLLHSSCALAQEKPIPKSSSTESNKTMELEIWSDVVCPFCYIGKTNLDQALGKFAHKNEVKITWKSFQLNPEAKTDATINLYQSLANSKSISIKEAKEMAGYATDMAEEVGLKFNFEKAVVANSYRAHQLLHLAKKHGVQNQVKKNLFAAYFTDGKNIDDLNILVNIGVAAGLDKAEVETTLSQNSYAKEIQSDLDEARSLKITGVPFFVFNKKYAVSGAQPADSLLQVLQKSYLEIEGK